jgi:hypothetical protein
VKSLFSLSLMLQTNELMCLLVASYFSPFLRLKAWPVGGSTVVECLSHLVNVKGSSLAAMANMQRKRMVKKIFKSTYNVF